MYLYTFVILHENLVAMICGDRYIREEVSVMDASMISEIAKAKRYAEEPERIQFTRFEATFRGEGDIYITVFNNGTWTCTCDVFQNDGECQHTMAMQRVLGVTIPKVTRHMPIKQIHQEEDPIVSTVNIQDIRIRITEAPLTPLNLITILSALTELYTKCWLIVRGQSADLIEYTQTHSSRFTEEANLVISRIIQNSPLNIDWKLDASPQGLVIALAEGIDAITQASHRVESVVLDNRAKELTFKLKELETKAELADKEQTRHIAAQKAELEKQAALLDLEKQRLEVVAKRLEVEKMRIDYALEIAGNMVTILRPNADEETRTMLLQTLIPNLLQLSEGKGLELVLPVPQNRKSIAE
jgi:hypothetical protein